MAGACPRAPRAAVFPAPAVDEWEGSGAAAERVDEAASDVAEVWCGGRTADDAATESAGGRAGRRVAAGEGERAVRVGVAARRAVRSIRG